MIEITATTVKQRHHRNGFAIYEVQHEKGENKTDNKQPRYAVLGEDKDERLEANITYRFYGHWERSKREFRGEKPMQFRFKSFVPARPMSRRAVVNYLAKHGQGLMMGRQRAATLFEKFLDTTIEKVMNEPEVAAAAVSGWRTSDAIALAERLKERESIMSSEMEMMDLLDGRGFAKTAPTTMIQQLGNRAPEFVARNPYLLMKYIRGAGFGKCDAMYLDLGLPPHRLKRQALCAWYSIASSGSSNTWFPASVVARGIRQHAGGTKLRVEEAIKLAIKSGLLQECWTEGPKGKIVDGKLGGTRWLAEGSAERAETFIANHLVESREQAKVESYTVYESVEEAEERVINRTKCSRCSRELTADKVHVWDGLPFGPTCIGYICGEGESQIVDAEEWFSRTETVIRTHMVPAAIEYAEPTMLWPDPELLDISEHQKDKYAEIHHANQYIASLGGSPGTGKTYTAARIIKAIADQIGLDEIACCAPTNIAANRLTEVLGEYGIELRARSIHSTLGVEAVEDGGWEFTHDQYNPLPVQFLIVDEASMIDTALMRSLLAARGRGTHVLFVGDINQLLPVGHGAPLRDMIRNGIPYGELTEIRRNSGLIVEACHSMRDGKRFHVVDYPDGSEEDNLVHFECSSPEHQIGMMKTLIDRLSKEEFDPVWECQVLVPVNKKSELARVEINKILQAKLNMQPGEPGQPFRKNDKVISKKNSFYELHLGNDPYDEDVIVNQEGEVRVANGELGKVLEVNEKSMIVELFSPKRIIFVPRGKADSESGDTGCNWELGYALSVHKAQGSEWPVGILMIDEYSGANNICDRSWYYTGISRAKKYAFTIGRLNTMYGRCRKVAIEQRKTLLNERINDIESLNLLGEI